MKEISSQLKHFGSELSQNEPIQRIPGETAAVAVILKASPKKGDQVLLIRRAARSGDPWSGQIAFPGGRVESTDSSFAATAARETSEEVGFDLSSNAEFLGYMDQLEPKNRRIQVVPVVFFLMNKVEVLASEEVVSHRWIPVSGLSSNRNRAKHTIENGNVSRAVPAFRFGDYLVWGLTERLLTRLAQTIKSQ